MSEALLFDSSTSLRELAAELHEAQSAFQEARILYSQAELRVTQVATVLSAKAAEEESWRNWAEPDDSSPPTAAAATSDDHTEPQFHEPEGSEDEEKPTKKQNELDSVCPYELEIIEKGETQKARYYCVTEVPKGFLDLKGRRFELAGLKGIHWCSWTALKIKFGGKNPNHGGKVAAFDSWWQAVEKWHVKFTCDPPHFPQ
jgi:hypothetical protein